MNFSALFRILVTGWWIIVLALMVTVGATLFFTFTQSPVYQAVTTLVVVPKDLGDPRDSLHSLDTLDRRTLVATFAKIPASQTVREKAQAQLGLTSAPMQPYEITVRVVPDTNILQVSVEGPAPDLVQRLANAVAEQARHRGEEFYGLYELKVLDPASQPSLPVRPEKARNLAVGIVLGLMLGVGVALGAEYFRQSKSAPAANVEATSTLKVERLAARKSDG